LSVPRFYGERPPGIQGVDLPGRLIVIEGTDGVGRSTQVGLLKEWLEARGYAVVNTGLRRSDLAGRGIERAKRGNTLDPLTLNLLYATDFADRMRAGMVALVDRYIFSLMARARVRGLTAEWVENLFGFALVPDLVVYLDIDVEHLVPRVLSSTGFDYWESGQDYLPSPEVYQNFVEHQTRLLAEFRRLATEHAFITVDARKPIPEVFRALCEVIEPVVQTMVTSESVVEDREAVASSLL
jgi:dTMP kinase